MWPKRASLRGECEDLTHTTTTRNRISPCPATVAEVELLSEPVRSTARLRLEPISSGSISRLKQSHCLLL